MGFLGWFSLAALSHLGDAPLQERFLSRTVGSPRPRWDVWGRRVLWLQVRCELEPALSEGSGGAQAVVPNGVSPRATAGLPAPHLCSLQFVLTLYSPCVLPTARCVLPMPVCAASALLVLL